MATVSKLPAQTLRRTIGASVAAAALICTSGLIASPAQAADAAFDVSLSSNPADGGTVHAGDTVEYTVNVSGNENSAGLELTTLVDLSDIVDNGVVNENSVSASTGSSTLEGETLTWTGVADNATITFDATVDDDQVGESLSATVGGFIKDPASSSVVQANCGVDPETMRPTGGEGCSSTVTIAEDSPAESPMTVALASDPADGSTVHPGDTVTYSVDVSRSDEAEGLVLDTVVDLRKTLENGKLVDDSIGATAGEAELNSDANTIEWTGNADNATITFDVIAGEQPGGTLTATVGGFIKDPASSSVVQANCGVDPETMRPTGGEGCSSTVTIADSTPSPTPTDDPTDDPTDEANGNSSSDDSGNDGSSDGSDDTSSSDTTSNLPRTGAGIAGLIAGLALVGLGGAAVLITRRRKMNG